MIKFSCKGILDSWSRKVIEDIIEHERRRKLAVKENLASFQGKNDKNLVENQPKRVLNC